MNIYCPICNIIINLKGNKGYCALFNANINSVKKHLYKITCNVNSIERCDFVIKEKDYHITTLTDQNSISTQIILYAEQKLYILNINFSIKQIIQKIINKPNFIESMVFMQ